MAKVTFTSREAYYEHVASGKATDQRARIMRYFLKKGEPMTRRQVDDYFDPRVYIGEQAKDGGHRIRTNASTARINALLESGYLRVDHIGTCPVSKRQAEFLAPIVEDYQQRRMF